MTNSLTQKMNPIEAPMATNENTRNLVAKEQARIQGQIFMAKQFPRNMGDVENRIKSSCERVSLAQISEYEYPRGGQKIVGASIRLLETVAQCYGNISYSWKELSRDTLNHKSTCLAYAWDLETNVYTELEFEVAHKRDKKSGSEILTDERDIYEIIANNAARRVRKCLEGVVPKDIVDQAREWCNETLDSKVDYQKGIDKGVEYFANEYNVKLSQIETYFGMSRRAFTKNTYLALQRIVVSVKDGMSKVTDFFPKEEGKNTLRPEKTEIVEPTETLL